MRFYDKIEESVYRRGLDGEDDPSPLLVRPKNKWAEKVYPTHDHETQHDETDVTAIDVRDQGDDPPPYWLWEDDEDEDEDEEILIAQVTAQDWRDTQ